MHCHINIILLSIQFSFGFVDFIFKFVQFLFLIFLIIIWGYLSGARFKKFIITIMNTINITLCEGS